MSNEASFTEWANDKFGPAPDPGIPQTERFASYFECWKAAKNDAAQHLGMAGREPVRLTPELVREICLIGNKRALVTVTELAVLKANRLGAES